ncbi:BQ2448_6951 [Microbotryum intermedium]|uniref:ER membrane protein complex subunit 1 n=1 Tax=Microbotryum intermedium TaxID=269621 RepID=A0A238FPK5_9BASI|nr:BQ2448_6951 [Microbotryum intermedium]
MLLLLLTVLHSTAIRALGSPEWHRVQIGRARARVDFAAEPLHQFKHVANHDDPTRRQSILLTVTDKNILAALDPANGTLRWRRSYGPDAHRLSYFACGDDSLVVSSRADLADLQVVDASTGELRWASPTSGAVDVALDPAQVAGDAICWADHKGPKRSLISYSQGTLRRKDVDTGAESWHVEVAGWDPTHRVRLARTQANKLFVFAWPEREPTLGSLRIYNASNGNPLSDSVRVEMHGSADHMPFVVSFTSDDDDSGALVWVSGSSVRWFALTSSREGVLAEGVSSDYVRVSNVGLAGRGIFLAHRRDGTVVVLRWNGASLNKLWDLNDSSFASLFSGFVDRENEAHIGHLSFSPTLQLASVQILSLVATPGSPTGMITGHTFTFDSEDAGDLLSFAIETAPVRDYSVASRVSFASTSGLLQAQENGRFAWVRDEALADIDLQPVMVQVSSGFARLRTSPISRLLGYSVNADMSTPLAVVGSSRSQTIHALDAKDSGKVLWRYFFPFEEIEWETIFIAHLSGNETTPSVCLNATARTSDNRLISISLDARTGRELDRHTTAPFSSLSTRGLGSGCEIKIEAGDGLVEGWSFCDREVRLLWRFKLPGGHTVVRVVGNMLDTVASPGRVLGDRSTLLKYLNHGMVAVAAISESTSQLTFIILDAANGHCLHEVLHDGIRTSNEISISLRDNWVVYTIHAEGDPSTFTRVRSLELFHQTSSLAIEAGKSLSSLWPDLAKISVSSTSFLSTDGLKIRGLTRTRLGITSYSAICPCDRFISIDLENSAHTWLSCTVAVANSMSQVIALPRRYLDPRRHTRKPTREDHEELLIPYEAVLPNNPRWVLSRAHEVSWSLPPQSYCYRALTLSCLYLCLPAQVSDVQVVHSYPGDRESESAILALGIDLFGTRMSPSKSFDVLSPLFNKVQLGVTLSILSIATIVSRHWVRVSRVPLPRAAHQTNSVGLCASERMLRCIPNKLAGDGTPCERLELLLRVTILASSFGR